MYSNTNSPSYCPKDFRRMVATCVRAVICHAPAALPAYCCQGFASSPSLASSTDDRIPSAIRQSSNQGIMAAATSSPQACCTASGSGSRRRDVVTSIRKFSAAHNRLSAASRARLTDRSVPYSPMPTLPTSAELRKIALTRRLPLRECPQCGGNPCVAHLLGRSRPCPHRFEGYFRHAGTGAVASRGRRHSTSVDLRR